MAVTCEEPIILFICLLWAFGKNISQGIKEEESRLFSYNFLHCIRYFALPVLHKAEPPFNHFSTEIINYFYHIYPDKKHVHCNKK